MERAVETRSISSTGGAFPPPGRARTQSRHRVWFWSSTCLPEDGKLYEEKRVVGGAVPGVWSLRGGRRPENRSDRSSREPDQGGRDHATAAPTIRGPHDRRGLHALVRRLVLRISGIWLLRRLDTLLSGILLLGPVFLLPLLRGRVYRKPEHGRSEASR